MIYYVLLYSSSIDYPSIGCYRIVYYFIYYYSVLYVLASYIGISYYFIVYLLVRYSQAYLFVDLLIGLLLYISYQLNFVLSYIYIAL